MHAITQKRLNEFGEKQGWADNGATGASDPAAAGP